jgi:glycosyltransferase involved in cell wall biosynthesis
VNVLFLDQFSALGGAQQCLLDLLPAVEERGWKARAAVPTGGQLVGLLRGQGVTVDEVRCGPYRSGQKSAADILRFAADTPALAAKIADLLDRNPTDLIYVNGPRMLIPAALGAHGRVPILFHAHHAISQRSAAYLEGLALKYSRATVAACCEAVARPVRKWVAGERIHVIPNGTRDMGFRVYPLPDGRGSAGRGSVMGGSEAVAGGSGARIGVIGRISPEKGQAEFLRAAALLVARMPDARFVICGAPLFGDRSYYLEVLRLAAHLPVEFLDWQEDVGVVMRELDVLVIPSRQEGMPRVLLEAFSAGVPVVAFPVGGMPEVIEDGVTGFLARGDLATTLEYVLGSGPKRLRDVARNARRQWDRRYTVAAYRAGITTLMEQCVRHPRSETAAPRPRRSEMHPPAPKDSRSG